MSYSGEKLTAYILKSMYVCMYTHVCVYKYNVYVREHIYSCILMITG